jgi:uncharacterized surface protein with fasciclin (FAS1) repeats
VIAMRKLLASILLAFAAVGATTAAAQTEQPTTQRNLVQTAAEAGQFNTLVSLVDRAGLAGALSGDDKLTVFAPTDAAFRKVPRRTLDRLMRNRALLRRVLLYHVVAGDVKAEQVSRLRSVKTLAGARIRVRVRDGNVFLNRSTRVVQADVAASNGTIHVIDRVLLPPRR